MYSHLFCMVLWVSAFVFMEACKDPKKDVSAGVTDGNSLTPTSSSDPQKVSPDATQEPSMPAGSSAATAADPSRKVVYDKGLALVGKSNCLTCHHVDDKLIGPSYREIAIKYAGAPNATITALAGKIIKGGAGTWGTVPMNPNPQISQDDAEAMVRYILELNNRSK